MNESGAREQHIAELLRLHKDIEETLEARQGFVGCFQALMQSSGLFSQVVDNLPFPVAIFAQSGVVNMANKVLMRQAGIGERDIAEEKIKLLNRVTDENYEVFEAVEDVFVGETTVLRNLIFPLELFSRDERQTEQDTYHSAIFFPITGSDGSVRLGAVMLMN